MSRTVDRRNFLKFSGLTLVSTQVSASSPESASDTKDLQTEFAKASAVLVDVSECIGCRSCEWACRKENSGYAETMETYKNVNLPAFETERRPGADSLTVVNTYTPESDPARPSHVKVQCMHCLEPACASACLVGAMKKTPDGPVAYNAGKCIGCRYCMVACPFEIPDYEYENALTPEVKKCSFCAHRIAENKPPACVEICPNEALTFGPRQALLDYAHRRIHTHPDVYENRVYGEVETGGTSWLYLFPAERGHRPLPALPGKPVQATAETIQHSIFKSFFGPMALFSLLGISMHTLKGSRESGDTASSVHEAPRPVKSPGWTWGVAALATLALAGFAAYAYRLIFGLGASTHLTSSYPWGIWIAMDVATGVALAAGGFTTAAISEIFHRDKYHVLTRPALLTALLGYTFVVIGLQADLGRYYNVWHPILPSMWNGSSVLFEVGICVMIYLSVLYIEFIPVVVDRFRGGLNFPGPLSFLNKPADAMLGFADRNLRRFLWIFIILGVVLSCLHQSSLGTLMAVSPAKLHPLWSTPVSPLLFLMSAIAVGFPMVVFESLLASRAFRLKPEISVLASLARMTPFFLTLYLALRLGDLTLRDAWPRAFSGSLQAWSFWGELLMGAVLPILLLINGNWRRKPVLLFTASSMVILGVAWNRLNVFLVGYQPLYAVKAYFPSVPEIILTVGLISTLVLVYRLAVIHLPVLTPSPKTEE